MQDDHHSRPRRFGGRRVRPSIGPSGADVSDPRVWRAIIRRRVLTAAAIVGVWSVGIEARLFYLQVLHHDELAARAERQQSRVVEAPPKRGEILDRNGRVLAYSVDADTIYATPYEIEDADGVAAKVCQTLDACDEREQQVLADRFRKKSAFAYVKRQASPEEAERVAALGLPGIGFMQESRRFYPTRELAAHVLGFVGIDGAGLHGIESTYNSLISGRPGKTLVQTDARRQAFSRVERPPTAGATLELTLDQTLQYIVERELHAAIEANRAEGGTAIVMNPFTAEILALANEPTFNPNAYGRYPAAVRRNRAIQDLYEPGSTFKVVTASAAFEENVVRADDPIDVSAGSIRFGRRVVDDVHTYGVLSFADVIVKSSNVGAIKVGLRLGPERLVRYVTRFGFGKPTSRDFRGESGGIVWSAGSLDDSALASVSMGYQVGVTPLQMAAAVSAVANGGELVEPRLVRAIITGGRRTEVQRHVVRRAIEPGTAALLTTIMEDVVTRGTGTSARLAGFPVAGKTGTAKKIVNGAYSDSAYNASFVGFVPSRNPVFTILVLIDTPRDHGYYGGVAAGPAFKRIAEEALRYAGVAPVINPEPPVLVARRPNGEAGPHTVSGSADALPMPAVTERADLMPELTGLSAREAVLRLANLGLDTRVTGNGWVASQDPPAGTPLHQAQHAALRLRRYPSPARTVGLLR